jgi:hypothetical protein
MSLAEALKDIADRMDSTREEFQEDLSKIATLILKNFAAEIRFAVKLSESVSVPLSDGLKRAEPLLSYGPGRKAYEDCQAEQGEPVGKVITAELVRRSEENAKKSAQLARAEESDSMLGPTMTECINGDSHGDLVPVNSAMQTGNKTILSGEIYALGTDRKLYYQEEATRQYREQLRKSD